MRSAVTPRCVCVCVYARERAAQSGSEAAERHGEGASDKSKRVSQDYPRELPDEPPGRAAVRINRETR